MKFPVLKALQATFAYLAGNPILLLKSLWLPTLLLTGVILFVMGDYFDGAIAITKLGQNPDAVRIEAAVVPIAKSGGVMLLASAIFYPMIAVASLRHIVRGDTLKAPFYLGYGGDELRVLGAYILLMLVFFAGYIVFALALGVIAGLLAVVSPAAAAIAAPLLLIALLVAMFWFLTRLSLTFPAALSLKTLGLAQSWQATKGKSATLFLFWAAIVIFMAIVAFAYLTLSMPGTLPIYGEMIAAAADEAAQQQASIKLLELQRDLVDPTKPQFWPYAAGTFVYTMIASAVFYVAAGAAWRYAAGEGDN